MSETKTPIRIGLLGAGYIGQVHSLALCMIRTARRKVGDHQLTLLVDHNPGRTAEVAERYGWQETRGDWRDVVDADLDLFVNASPNALHHEPTVAAARRRTAVFCEKPLARNADEALDLYRQVEAAGVEHRCAYVHRFVPALQLARQLIRDGELGELLHYRSRFLMNMHPADEPTISWRFDRSAAGTGAISDLGSHHIDVARFLVGEVRSVSSVTATWTHSDHCEVNDDAFACVAELEGGVVATFEASRRAGMHALTGEIEVDGSKASLAFSMERFNELRIRRAGAAGETTRMVTALGDPYVDFWLPAGIQGNHPIGWQECFAFQMLDVVGLVTGDVQESPAATFRDGYRIAEVVDAIERSAVLGTRERVDFRDRVEPIAGVT